MSPEEKKAEEERVGAVSNLTKITHAGYNSLELIRYFTAGPDEVRAWTIRKGTKAPAAAGVIQYVYNAPLVPCPDFFSQHRLREEVCLR